MRRCPGCGDFVGNHSVRGCYVPGCRCKRNGLELLAQAESGLETVIPFRPELLPIREELEAAAARIRA